jgi:hypothetical protein
MIWLLKLLGISPKSRRVVKSVSQIVKSEGRGQRKASARKLDTNRTGLVVDLDELPHDQYEIVGESFYQDVLAKYAGPRTDEGVNHKCEVLLVCERGNKFDKNAVRVEIEGEKVGYLHSGDAVLFREMLKEEGMAGVKVKSHAVINGGWKNRKNEGHYGIVLDFEWEEPET